jgi:hypothetical protein
LQNFNSCPHLTFLSPLIKKINFGDLSSSVLCVKNVVSFHVVLSELTHYDEFGIVTIVVRACKSRRAWRVFMLHNSQPSFELLPTTELYVQVYIFAIFLSCLYVYNSLPCACARVLCRCSGTTERKQSTADGKIPARRTPPFCNFYFYFYFTLLPWVVRLVVSLFNNSIVFFFFFLTVTCYMYPRPKRKKHRRRSTWLVIL